LKFAPALWFSVAILSGLSLWQLTELFRKKVITHAIRLGLFAMLLAITYPFFSSTFFTWSSPFSTKVTVPSYVIETTQLLQSGMPPTGRVLLLPPFDTQTHADSYQWGYWSLNTLPGSAFSRSVVANDAHNPPSIVEDIYEALQAHDLATARVLLHRAGITHILWRDDILWFDKKTTAAEFAKLRETLIALPFSQTSTNGSWSIYTTTDKPVPLVHAVSDIALIYGKRPRLSTFAENLPDTTAVVFSPPPASRALQPMIHQEIVGAQCIYCRALDRQAFQNALHVIPPKILPGTLLYPLVMWKESRQWNGADTGTERIDALLAFSLRRLAELAKLKPKSMMRENRLVAYQQTIDQIMKEFHTLQGLDTATYAVKIALYMEAQQNYMQANSMRIPQPLIKKLIDDQTTLRSSWRMNDDKGLVVQLQFPIQTAGTYRLIPPFEIQKQAHLTIDGRPVPSTLTLLMDPGLHTVTIHYNQPHPQYDVPFVRVERVEQIIPSATPSIKFTRVNPALVRVSLPKRDAPMALVFREAYHPEWILSSYADKSIGTEHFTVDGYANGWIVPAGPAIETTISYYPQQIFYIGIGISIISFGIIAMILFFNKRKH
jgi:hypothetical protein